MHECGADINTIELVLGNDPKTVSNHYVITSGLSFDAWEIGCAYANGKIIKKEN